MESAELKVAENGNMYKMKGLRWAKWFITHRSFIPLSVSKYAASSDQRITTPPGLGTSP